MDAALDALPKSPFTLREALAAGLSRPVGGAA